MENFVITIARQYGSGGRTVGKMLAEKLGVSFYDKQIIQMASDESGIDVKLFGQVEEGSSVKASLFNKTGLYKGDLIAPDQKGFVSDENIFNYQAKIATDLAEKESCVIVGRCVNYVFKDRPNTLRVFIHAPWEFRVEKSREKISGSDEAGDFDVGHFTGADDGSFYGGKVAAPGAVELWVPCLEVDVPCIDQGKKGSERLFVHAAVSDHGVHHAGLFDEGRGVTDEFVGQKGLVVRVGDADISFFPCGNGKVQDVLGRHAAEGRFCLGNFPVLTEGAAHVAAHAPDGEDARARMEVGEGLLLDGVERGGRAHAVCDGAQQPVVVQSRAAPASVVQRDLALVRAKMTDDAAIGISFIKYSFHDASERPEDQ